MKHSVISFGVACVSAVLVACASAGANELTESERKAILVAEAFVADKYPDFVKARSKTVIRSVDHNWEVTYRLPDDMIGGAPVVVIDKRSGQVVRSFRTQ